LWHGFRAGLRVERVTKAERRKILDSLVRDLELEEVADILDLGNRLIRLQLQGISLEDLKEENVEELKKLLGYVEEDTED
jgi:hypothetical protein